MVQMKYVNENCGGRIHASWHLRREMIIIKTLQEEHTCDTLDNNKNDKACTHKYQYVIKQDHTPPHW